MPVVVNDPISGTDTSLSLRHIFINPQILISIFGLSGKPSTKKFHLIFFYFTQRYALLQHKQTKFLGWNK